MYFGKSCNSPGANEIRCQATRLSTRMAAVKAVLHKFKALKCPAQGTKMSCNLVNNGWIVLKVTWERDYQLPYGN